MCGIPWLPAAGAHFPEEQHTEALATSQTLQAWIEAIQEAPGLAFTLGGLCGEPVDGKSGKVGQKPLDQENEERSL